MYKHNIEHDLLKTLKRQDKNNLFYIIKSIACGLYKFDIDYLNKIPLNVLLVYLEKIIVIGSKYNSLDSLASSLGAINAFCENINTLSFRDLNSNKQLNIKYYVKVRMARLAASLNKNNLVKVSSMLLSGFIFCNLYSKSFSFKSSNDYEVDNPAIEIYNDTKETLAFDNEYILAENTVPKESTNPSIVPETTTPDPTEITEVTTIPREPTNEEKLEYILEEYNLTIDEFNVVCAVALKEAKTNSYTDAYAVINTIYNRTISKTWVDYVSKIMGNDKGYSLYYQAVCSGQFEVYSNGGYKMYLDVRTGEFYQAIIDFLYTRDLMHNYLSFKSANTLVPNSVQFVSGGNNYHNEMKDDDRLDIEYSR